MEGGSEAVGWVGLLRASGREFESGWGGVPLASRLRKQGEELV